MANKSPYDVKKGMEPLETTIPYQFTGAPIPKPAVSPYDVKEGMEPLETTIPYQFTGTPIPKPAVSPYDVKEGMEPLETTIPYQFTGTPIPKSGVEVPTPGPFPSREALGYIGPERGEVVGMLVEDIWARGETLKRLQQAAVEDPQQRAAYEEYYREEYLPAYGRYKAVYEPYAEERERTKEREWGKFADELRKAGLTEAEIKGIAANLRYIESLTGLTETERQKRWEQYMKQWGPVITARAPPPEPPELKKPFSLKLMEAAHAFPEKYEATFGFGIGKFPKPIFDIGFPQVGPTGLIGGMAMGGAAIVGTFEELGMSLAGLFKPEAVAGYAPAPSPLAIALVPEYREKYWPGAVIAAPIIFPLEAKAIGAAFAPIAKGIKGTFRLAALKLPKGVQLELITKHQRIVRWLSLPEKYVKVRPPVFVGKTRDVWMKAATEGGRGYAEVGGAVREIFKPAPRWLIPKWMEKLLPSGLRTKYYVAQVIRKAAKPEWMTKSAYEALVKSAAEYTVKWEGPMLTQTFRTVLAGPKKGVALAIAQQSEGFALKAGMHSPSLAGVEYNLAQISSQMVPTPFVFVDTLTSSLAKAATGVGAIIASAAAVGIKVDEKLKAPTKLWEGMAEMPAYELTEITAVFPISITREAQAVKTITSQITKTMQVQQLQLQMQMQAPTMPFKIPFIPFGEEKKRPHAPRKITLPKTKPFLRYWPVGRIEKLFERAPKVRAKKVRNVFGERELKKMFKPPRMRGR